MHILKLDTILQCSESFIFCLILSNRYCSAVLACLRQHVLALVSVDRCQDNLYGQQSCPGICSAPLCPGMFYVDPYKIISITNN